MQLNIDVADEIRREAEVRGLSVIDFVDALIAKGFVAEMERPAIDNAINRIRALRSPAPSAKR